jgi:hypothetical protein
MNNPTVDLVAALAEMERRAEETGLELEEARRQAAVAKERWDALTQQHNSYYFGAQNLRAALSYEEDSDDAQR